MESPPHLPPPGLLEYFAVGPYPPSPLAGLGILLAVAYLAGAIRLWRKGRRWPISRTLCFLAGCMALVIVMGLGVESYGYAQFSVFMFQQLTLMMAIPPLLVLGSPGTLLLRATPHRGLGRAVLSVAHGALRSRAARWALSPAVALPLYLLAFYGLYLDNLADPILRLPGGHQALEIGFFLAGMLFTIPVLSDDPLPVRMSYGARALDLFAEAALHAFFGVFIMMSNTLMIGTFAESTAVLGLDPLEDQRVAGALAWSYGEAPTLFMVLYIMHRWFRDDTARARAHDRYADVHGDDDLDAYNAYLERLQKRTGNGH
ncbi:cytochrome c oxidase assembly protein [Microbacterium oryzae]|uniref:Cytochrome c oxidase assembly protein n=1 Tax=Microbacterium oryzae TaxID=743009 RepID=A0A6I6E4M0_9MICO|nr:cytochrome c oxidase assembly protein [Microbacterium oryzae]QGU27697.1 cytochrome c oxidase assembly protein [Microbacterium oryzae]